MPRWGSRSPKGKGNFWRLSGPLKSIINHCCVVCCKKINDGITALLLQRTKCCRLVHVTFIVSVKNPPLLFGLSSKFFVHLLLFASKLCFEANIGITLGRNLAMKTFGTEFWKFYHFLENVLRLATSGRHNSTIIIDRWKFATKLTLYGMSSFYFYR